MAAPIDGALYRMKAYATLLQADSNPTDGHAPGDDIMALVEWVEYARPLLGAVAPGANPFERQAQSQQMDFNTATDPGDPPAEDKPAA